MYNPNMNIDESLNNEQYFALVLAYNDKISGRKREKVCKEVLGEGHSFYKLTDSEMAGLELARKSDKGGEFAEDDVVKIFSNSCCEDVRDVLSQESSHTAKINALHKLSVSQKLLNSNFNSASLYIKLDEFAKRASKYDKQYQKTTMFLDSMDNLANEIKNSDKKQEFNAIKTQLQEIAPQELFSEALLDVTLAIGQDCYNSLNQITDHSFSQVTA